MKQYLYQCYVMRRGERSIYTYELVAKSEDAARLTAFMAYQQDISPNIAEPEDLHIHVVKVCEYPFDEEK